MSLDNLDLSFNPFDDDGTSEPTPIVRQHFAATFLPSLKPSAHRRRSSITDTENAQGYSRKRHTRSRTEVNIDIGTTPTLHPLKSAALRSATFTDVGITRPHLSRLVQDGTLEQESVIAQDDSISRSSSVREEKDVLIHEVTFQDSLAGVALKYGIPLSELRRANHLWSTDSIHLRKHLYIPIEQASRVQEYIQGHGLPTSEAAETDKESVPTSVVDASRSPSTSQLPAPAFPNAIHRVPTSQLSYFPPPSEANKSQPGSAEVSPASNGSYPSPYSHLKPSQSSGRHTSSPAHSLTSILTALPIAASTRDEIITRLSFDSTSSSYSDRSQSRPGSDGDSGHELDDVNKIRHLSIEDDEDDASAPSLSTATPKAPQTSTEIRLVNQTKSTASPPSLKTHYSHPSLSTSPPSSYVPQMHNSYVRTMQLEPSPGMQLPDMRTHAIGRSSSSSKTFTNSSSHAAGTDRLDKTRWKGHAANADFGIELDG